MARKPRIHVPGGFYHVMLRGNGGQEVFFTPRDHTKFYSLLQEGVEKFSHRISAFCLMPNHIHLVIQVDEVPLARIIQNLGFRYTQHLNHIRKTTGHRFQGRYKAILIEEDAYLLQLVRYIHLNPTRAGIVRAPEAYAWSSHRAYLGREQIPWLYTESILCHFSDREPVAQRLFSDFVLQGLQEGTRPEFRQGSHQGRILGDDHFAERALSTTGEPNHCRPSLPDIIDAVCRAYGLTPSALTDLGKKRKPAEARAMAALIVLETQGLTLTDLATYLGRELSGLSQAAGRLHRRKTREPGTGERLEHIRRDICKYP